MEFLVLNENFETVYVVDKFESIIWTDRFSQYGDFEIYTSADVRNVSNIKQDFYLWSEHSEHLMIIEDTKIEADVENGTHLTVTGRSIESLLERRIIWSQTNLNGLIEDQILQMITANIISPSDVKRKIPNFTYELSNDPYIATLRVEAQFYGETLYEAIKKLCDSVNIGFKITLNNQNQFVFKLYSGTDRSYDQEANPYVVFSPNFENIVNSNYFNSKASFKNVTLVAGEGEGLARKTYTVGQTNLTGVARRELFTDARDVSSNVDGGTLSTAQYNNLLQQRGLESLAEHKVTQSFDGQVESTQMYRYGEHYNMGDIVQLENEYHMESKVRVTEFIYSESDSGSETYPTFEVIEQEEVA